MKTRDVNHLFSLICAFVLLAGCAFTTTNVPLNYTVTDSLPPTLQSEPANSIDIGKIYDKRGCEDPCLIFHKYSGYGQKASGLFAAEAPIAEIVEGALEEGLLRMNFGVAEQTSPFELYGNLINLDYETISAFLGPPTFKSRITITLFLKEKSTSRLLWTDTFNGHALTKQSDYLFDDTGFVRAMFNNALDDCIKQVVSSETLINNLK